MTKLLELVDMCLSQAISLDVAIDQLAQSFSSPGIRSAVVAASAHPVSDTIRRYGVAPIVYHMSRSDN